MRAPPGPDVVAGRPAGLGGPCKAGSGGPKEDAASSAGERHRGPHRGAARAEPFGSAEAAEDGDDLPEDLRLVAVDRVEGGVVGEELDVAAPA
jgi:hypothetical protein